MECNENNQNGIEPTVYIDEKGNVFSLATNEKVGKSYYDDHGNLCVEYTVKMIPSFIDAGVFRFKKEEDGSTKG